MGNQQGRLVQHMELCSMLCASLDSSGVWGRMDACICMAESLRCSSETAATSLISRRILYQLSHEGSLSLLQRIFPTQELKWGLLHCRRILYQLSYEGSPISYIPIQNKKFIKFEKRSVGHRCMSSFLNSTFCFVGLSILVPIQHRFDCCSFIVLVVVVVQSLSRVRLLRRYGL